jgi:hypothetical protein
MEDLNCKIVGEPGELAAQVKKAAKMAARRKAAFEAKKAAREATQERQWIDTPKPRTALEALRAAGLVD